ncbi:PIH1 domain-containing protein 1 [Fopius arisanus]|uniref:PIH1 domain-containing protein 1 n=1 Tax=Fopius arisanus TaxID=64838 RepID=A0A9R1U6J1_9HYME|nr:PREDICTED: PIH1 domain-containing protein 1-like [Fopius arisanus]
MPNTLLDVDESLLKKNLLLAEYKENEDEFDRLLKTLEEPHTPSVVFRPHPGVCVKTKVDSGGKIFVNICHTTEIPPPEDISDDRFHEILAEDSPAWCIPMSIGHERLEADKSGSQCPTYDVAINTKFYNKCQEKKHFFAFAVLTILSAIGEKYDKVVDSENYVVLKNRKVVGKLHDHRVAKRPPKYSSANSAPKPLIQEISENKLTKSKDKKQMLESVQVADNSHYVIFRTPKAGEPQKLIGYFKLPNQCSKNDIRADIGEDRILIDVISYNYLVDIFVPFAIDQSSTTASLDTDLNILRVDMPLILT